MPGPLHLQLAVSNCDCLMTPKTTHDQVTASPWVMFVIERRELIPNTKYVVFVLVV